MGKFCCYCMHEFEDEERYYCINGESVCDDCVRADEEFNAIPIEELKKLSKTNYKGDDEQ